MSHIYDIFALKEMTNDIFAVCFVMYIIQLSILQNNEQWEKCSHYWLHERTISSDHERPVCVGCFKDAPIWKRGAHYTRSRRCGYSPHSSRKWPGNRHRTSAMTDTAWTTKNRYPPLRHGDCRPNVHHVYHASHIVSEKAVVIRHRWVVHVGEKTLFQMAVLVGVSIH